MQANQSFCGNGIPNNATLLKRSFVRQLTLFPNIEHMRFLGCHVISDIAVATITKSQNNNDLGKIDYFSSTGIWGLYDVFMMSRTNPPSIQLLSSPWVLTTTSWSKVTHKHSSPYVQGKVRGDHTIIFKTMTAFCSHSVQQS